MKFSIIVVTFNRKKSLISCLKSIKDHALKVEHEVIVVLNGDLAYLEKYKTIFPEYTFMHIPFTTTANARNMALKKIRGEYVLFLDENCILPKKYFENIDFNLGWDALGGPNLPMLSANSFQKLIGRTLASPLCMGPSFKRHSCNKKYDFSASEVNLTPANLWFRSSLFTREGFQFDSNLFKNEEYGLLNELENKGKIFHYNPNLYAYHVRSPNMEKLGAALIQSGKYRAQLFCRAPKRENLIYLGPLLFLFFFLFTVFSPNIYFLAPIAFYTILILAYDLKNHRRLSLHFVLLHFIIQFCYSVGLIKGFVTALKEFYNNLRENKSSINESRSK